MNPIARAPKGVDDDAFKVDLGMSGADMLELAEVDEKAKLITSDRFADHDDPTTYVGELRYSQLQWWTEKRWYRNSKPCSSTIYLRAKVFNVAVYLTCFLGLWILFIIMTVVYIAGKGSRDTHDLNSGAATLTINVGNCDVYLPHSIYGRYTWPYNTQVTS